MASSIHPRQGTQTRPEAIPAPLRSHVGAPPGGMLKGACIRASEARDRDALCLSMQATCRSAPPVEAARNHKNDDGKPEHDDQRGD